MKRRDGVARARGSGYPGKVLDLIWRASRGALFRLEAERAHRLVLAGLGAAPWLAKTVLARLAGPPPAQLARAVGPLHVAGPVGLAAGLDKDGEALTVWPALGFGFVEVGTVTALPQPGNPRPRLFRLPEDRALINRMGFNNHGSEALAARMRRLREADQWPSVPVGANIGKSRVTALDDAPADYLLSVERLAPFVDYLTVNISSPNTPGLRDLGEAGALARLLDRIVPAARGVPVFVKLSPDSAAEALAAAVEVSIEAGCAGLIATNTTATRPGQTGRTGEQGGLSGAPLWPIARAAIDVVLQAAAGRLPVIGVGGVSDATRVQELLDAGCASVQIYSAMIFEGPGLIARINQKLATARP